MPTVKITPKRQSALPVHHLNKSGPTDRLRSIIIPQPELLEGVFLERMNRFVGMVDVGGQSGPAHIPCSGRLRELLFPGSTIYVTPMPAGKRTQYRIHLARCGETLVSVDSLLPNRLMYHALTQQALPQFEQYREIKREVGWGESRFDLCLKVDEGICFIEVKSVTLVEDGRAKFPDAPSERGRKHLQELTRAVTLGFRAAVIFVVQRDDARIFSPNPDTDPLFARALGRAASAGVEIYALACTVTKEAVGLHEYLPVALPLPRGVYPQ
jgi:sugar fermentation stimulation protein A